MMEHYSATDHLNDWPEISEIPKLLPRAPTMTVSKAQRMLPSSIQDWILDFASRAQVPIESAAVCALGSLATVIGRKIGIYPKINDSHWIPCVFWTAIVARPGERKSSIISFGQKPLDMLEGIAQRQHKSEMISALAKKEILKQKIEMMKEEIKKASKGKGPKRIEVLEVELRELFNEEQEDPQEKRYRTNDATVEKLGDLLRGNPQGLLVVRDELIGWFKGFDKPGRENDRAFFLEGWDSTGAPYSVDRIGRKRVVVESLCLQVMGGIQPSALEDYVRQAVSGKSGDDGLLQRFQLLVYPESINTVEWRDEKPNQDALARVQNIFEWLDTFKPSIVEERRYGLHFNSDAQEIFKQWSVDLEKRFRLNEDEHPAFVSHLSKYLRLMPALSLLFHMVDCADTGQVNDGISASHAQMAVEWCEFLEAHARKVYAIIEKQEVRVAHSIKRRIQQGDISDAMKIRDIAQKCWSQIGSDVDAIREAIHLLESFGYCKLETIKPQVGRPSEIVRLSPHLSLKGVKND